MPVTFRQSVSVSGLYTAPPTYEYEYADWTVAPAPIEEPPPEPTGEYVQVTDHTRPYRHAPDDTGPPHVPEAHFHALASIFQRYEVQHKFGLRLLHGHLKDQRDMMLATLYADPAIRWAKPMIAGAIPDDIHGHIFMLTPDGRFVAVEYREGPPGDFAGTDPAFFQEFADYLFGYNLASVIGLQVLYNGMVEQ